MESTVRVRTPMLVYFTPDSGLHQSVGSLSKIMFPSSFRE
jgi:hypothetical protein